LLLVLHHSVHVKLFFRIVSYRIVLKNIYSITFIETNFHVVCTQSVKTEDSDMAILNQGVISLNYSVL